MKPLVEWLNARQPPEPVVLVGTALLVGLGAGFGAITFRWLIQGAEYAAFSGGQHLLSFLGRYYVVLIPALGGLIVGPLVYLFAREARGHGVPEVMEAVALRGGRIRPVVGLVKALASSICIGTGGSVGREGPIVQIGSALGSTIGQVLQMSHKRIRMLVACGAAGGIAATFNAPVAGVLFALEVILDEFTVRHFSTVVVSSVTASVISRVFIGDIPAFAVPAYALQSTWELLFFLVLGMAAAPVGVGFIRFLYATEDVFDSLRFPEYFKPVLGGLAVGAIGVYAPQVFGVGYEAIERALHNQTFWTVAGALLLAKTLATSLTLGSGGSGGVFAPSLFLGAMLGSMVGGWLNIWLPGMTAPPGAYALVGMAAVFAAGANAPMTAVIIVFEMTGDYRIILPLMLATVVAALIARELEPESIYSMKLSRRGVRLEKGRDIDVMQSVRVSEVMSTDTSPVADVTSLEKLSEHFWRVQRHACPVLDEKGELHGIVSINDLEQAIASGRHHKLTAGDIATRSLVTVDPDDSVWTALQRMGPRDLSSLPVVDAANKRKLLGMVRRRDIVKAYNAAIVRRQEIQHKMDQVRLGEVTGAGFIDLIIADGSPVTGKALMEISLPRGAVIVSIHRGNEFHIPHGDTVLNEGDKITAFVERGEREELLRCFAPRE